MNELLLLGSVLLYFSGVLLAEKLFGKYGLYVWVAIASVLMNIEVVKLIDAYGMVMTLGNALLTSTLLATDILGEKYGKADARRAAFVGCFAICVGLIATQYALLFAPSASDYVHTSMQTVFAQVPRICLASFITYFVVELSNVWLYHRIWALTEKRVGRDRFLWVRNVVSTLASQLINAFMFTFIGWFGVVDMSVCLNLALSTFVLAVVLSLLDTPFLYLSRRFIKVRGEQDQAPEA